MRRVTASRTIVRQRAIRNTALKNAPRISALNHCKPISWVVRGTAGGKQLTPNEYLSVEDFLAAVTAQSPTIRDMISFNYTIVRSVLKMLAI